MGKKQRSTNESSKGRKLSAGKRNELKSLADAILVKSREKCLDANAEFQQFQEIDSLLERIKKIESELKQPFKAPRDSEVVIENFIAWSCEHGAKFPKIQLKKVGEFDLGLVAKEALKKDEVFIQIPDSMIFAFSKIQQDMPQMLRNRVFLDCPLFDGSSHIRLAFALMVEKLNPNSKFKPYLDILPDKYRTVFYFTPNDMRELQGTIALSSALKQVKFIAAQYAFLYKFLMVAIEDHPVFEDLRDNFTYEFYCWAVSTVMSRQNLLPNNDEPESVLIGLWDMANHQNGTINTVLNESSNQIESFCLRDFQAGEQVTMAYGNRSNEDFLIHNGFVYPENDNKVLSIKLSLSKADELYDERVKLLSELGLKQSGSFQISPTFSDELMGFVRVFNMNKEQLSKWLESGDTKDLIKKIDLKLEPALEHKILIFLQIRIKIILKSFSTTLDEDKEYIKTQKRLNSNRAMLIQYRCLEKKILHETSEKIGEMLKNATNTAMAISNGKSLEDVQLSKLKIN